jgi:hypothetical protein
MALSTSPLYPDSGTADAIRINGTFVSGAKPANGQVLVYSQDIDEYVPQSIGGSSSPSDSYTEATFTDGQLTAMTTWTDSTKAQLVQTKTLTYTGVDLTQIAITDAAGALVLTKTLAYSGGNLASITEDYQ